MLWKIENLEQDRESSMPGAGRVRLGFKCCAKGASLGRTYGAERRKDERVGYAAAWENVPDRGKSPCKSGKLEACLVYLRKSKEACVAAEGE